MKYTILISIALLSGSLYAEDYNTGRKWKCTDRKGGSVITSMPCPIGMQSQEVDRNNNIIPNGYDPKANKQYWRCTSSLESLGHGASVYTENSCLISDPFNLMKYKGVRVNREGFTVEEMPIEIKRRENLAKQKEWEQGKNVNRTLSGGVNFEGSIETKRHDDCQSWKNSNIIDPTPEKQKYIKENCS